MPKISEIFSSRFLKAEHLNGKPRVVTIEGWNTELAYGESVYVIHMADELRSLRLSQTCARDIAQVCGDEMGEWAGHEIELYPVKQKITDKETNTEKLVDMIRARAVPGAAPASPSPKTIAKPTKPDFDDDIPF